MKVATEQYMYTLPIGRENAVHQQDLCRRWGVNARTVRAIIEELRLGGAFIVTGQEGYYLTDDPEEIEAYVRKKRAEAYSILRMLTPMRRYLLDRKKGKK